MTDQADPVAADEPRTRNKAADQLRAALREEFSGWPVLPDLLALVDAAIEAEARSLSDSEPSPGLRSAAWNLADSLLVGRDGESVSGQKAAVHWREKVMLQVGSYDPVTGDGYAPDQPQPALPSEPPLTNSGPTLSNTPTGQYHDGVMQTVRAEPERERAGDPLDVERLLRMIRNELNTAHYRIGEKGNEPAYRDGWRDALRAFRDELDQLLSSQSPVASEETP